jgi:hypothetical protein
MHGSWENILISTALALFGVWMFASGIQGYVVGIGPLFKNGPFAWVLRLPILVGAILIALPGEAVPGLNDWQLLGIGLVVMAPVILAALVLNRLQPVAVRTA